MTFEITSFNVFGKNEVWYFDDLLCFCVCWLFCFCVVTDKKEGESEDGANEPTGESKPESGKKEEKKKSDKKDDKKKDEKKPAAKKEPKKPKIETLKEPLEFEVTLTDLANMTADQKKASKDKLDALTEHDRAKRARYIFILT